MSNPQMKSTPNALSQQQDVFDDPVAFLAIYGIEAELVDDSFALAEAA